MRLAGGGKSGGARVICLYIAHCPRHPLQEIETRNLDGR
jgi:hypothetical protein